jgi:hypothetical protein
MKSHRRTAPDNKASVDQSVPTLLQRHLALSDAAALLPRDASVSDKSSQKSGRRRRRLIRFGFITVLEFKPILGDSPSVSCGVPVAMSPKHSRRTQFPVDDYEHKRRYHRRALPDLALDQKVRTKM